MAVTDVAALLTSVQRVVIVAHVKPDGDAIGSLSGLTLALRSLNMQVFPVLHDPVPEPFVSIIPEGLSGTFPHLDDVDLCIVVDTPDSIRTGFPDQVIALAKQGKLILIDHHIASDLLGMSAASVHEIGAASCAELVLRVVQEMGAKITSQLATTLLTGMYTDTGGFQQPNTTSDVLEAAAELMKRGARLQHVVGELHRNQSLTHLKLVGIALERACTLGNGRITLSYLMHSDLVSVGATPDDIAGIIGELNVLPTSAFSLLLVEDTPGIVRGVLRSNPDDSFMVNRLARVLGGGGHPRASGFSIPGQIVPLEFGCRVEPDDESR